MSTDTQTQSAPAGRAFPDIGTYEDVARLLRLSKKSIYRYKGRFPRGVELGHGRFNLTRLRYHIEAKGTFLRADDE